MRLDKDSSLGSVGGRSIPPLPRSSAVHLPRPPPDDRRRPWTSPTGQSLPKVLSIHQLVPVWRLPHAPLAREVDNHRAQRLEQINRKQNERWLGDDKDQKSRGCWMTMRREVDRWL